MTTHSPDPRRGRRVRPRARRAPPRGRRRPRRARRRPHPPHHPRSSRYARGRPAALLLHFGVGPVSFVARRRARSPLAKILENMEIGHNVMHGQYDWTSDPDARLAAPTSGTTSCTGDDWRHSHNYEHHTFTNILGQGSRHRLRLPARQRRAALAAAAPRPAALARGPRAAASSGASALHDLRIDRGARGQAVARRARARARGRSCARPAGSSCKDYVFFPALALWNAPRVLAGNSLANVIRNLWTFVDHLLRPLPRGRARLHARGDARRDAAASGTCASSTARPTSRAGALFHVLTGHLSHQIEHHLFPGPAGARAIPRSRRGCARSASATGCPTTPAASARQLGSVARQLVRTRAPLNGSAVTCAACGRSPPYDRAVNLLGHRIACVRG